MAEQYIESAVTDPETAEHLSRIASVRQRLEKAGRTDSPDSGAAGFDFDDANGVLYKGP